MAIRKKDLLAYIRKVLIVTDEDLEATIVMMIETGNAPAADYLARELRAKPMCEYCITAAEQDALGHKPVPRCKRCVRLVSRVTKEHANHEDYARFFCRECNAGR